MKILKLAQSPLKTKRYFLRCFENVKHLSIKISHLLMNTSDNIVE